MKLTSFLSLPVLSAIIFFKRSHLCVDGKANHTRIEPPRSLTLKDILDQRFVPYNGFTDWKWTPGINGSKVIHASTYWVWYFDVDKGDVWMQYPPDSEFGSMEFVDHAPVSATGKYFLLKNLQNSSSTYDYYVYNVEEKSFSQLGTNISSACDKTDLKGFLWAPSGNSLAFICGNNIFYRGNQSAEVQLTDDGSELMYNGLDPSHLCTGACLRMWFSPDGAYLVYEKANNTAVEQIHWPDYGQVGSSRMVGDLPTQINSTKYTKAGRPSHITSMHIVDLLKADLTNRPFVYTSEEDAKDRHCLHNYYWPTSTHFLIQHLNRPHNVSTWNLCRPENATCSMIYRYAQTQPKGWIISYESFVINNSEDDRRLLLVEPVFQPAINRYFRHIVSVPILVSNLSVKSRVMTSGNFNVDRIAGMDETWQTLFFEGSGITPTGEGEPREKHLYSISASLSNNDTLKEPPDCVTCGMQTTIGGDPCGYNIVTFSENFRYYLHSSWGPGVPEQSIRRTNDSRVVRMYETNDILRIKLGNVKLPIVREMEVDVEGGFKAKVRLLLPPNLDPLKKYPLVVEVYGGPDTQNVKGSFDVHWGTYLAVSKDMIYGFIDGRGSGRQSVDMAFSVYRNLGTPEVEDQIYVTKHLIETLPFIDGNRTAIWGTSYGGYAAAMVLGKDDQSVFKCGISIAPVTSWLLDKAAYVETYMGLPTEEDNLSAYLNSSSVLANVVNFRNKEFLLIHGTADTNVHYAHSMMLAKELQENDILFYQLSYPDQGHNLVSQNRQLHLTLERFLTRECFGLPWKKDE